MTKLSDIKRKSPKIILYGQVGTGKTAFALTGGEVVDVIDLDDGLLTGVTMVDKWTSERLKVNVRQCLEDSPSKALAFMKAQSYINSIAAECTAGKYPYKVLVIDSFSALADYATRDILAANASLGKNMTQPQWGLMNQSVLNVLVTLKSLPICVILIAHQRSMEIDGVDTLTLSIPGQVLPREVPKYFDEIWRTKVANRGQGISEYTIQSRGTASTMARTRANIADGVNMELGLREVLRLIGYEVGSVPASTDVKKT